MIHLGMGAVILEKPENVMYFTGFNPVLNSMPVFFIMEQDSEPILLVHCLRMNHAREESCIERIETYGMWGDVPSLAKEPAEAIRLLLGKCQGHLGLETEYISFVRYKNIL